MKEGGILPAIVGTLLLTLGTAVVAMPVGVGGAIYLAEYARDTAFTRAIRLAIVNLAGIPSIVYGLFGLGMFVLFLRFGTSILAGSLTLAIMTLPVIISTAEEALRAVPTEFRTVSAPAWAARAGRASARSCCRRPCRASSPASSWACCAPPARPRPSCSPWPPSTCRGCPRSPFDQTMALPYHLYVISTQVPGMPAGRPVRHGPGAAGAGALAELSRPPGSAATSGAGGSGERGRRSASAST